ncbi:MAG: 50S ribosomal protein L10 [Planctomycetaceae bacterium]|nr:50S ribosomal protein L10 [Planctomycetaceae bacterium]
MSRHLKDMLISDIESKIGDTKDFLVVDCSKLDAISANRMRLGLRESAISALTVKNSIARNALARKGVSGLDEVLAGPSTLVWGGEDVVALSKEIAKWAKEISTLQIKGGTVEGETIDAAGVDALSKSAGRLETIGQISGLMMSPGRMLAGALQGPGGMLAGALKTIADKEDAA